MIPRGIIPLAVGVPRFFKHTRILLPGIAAVIVAFGILRWQQLDFWPAWWTHENISEFRLEQLDDANRFLSHNDILGKITLINVWASWCLSCRDEHPLLLELAGSGNIPVVGINYRDKRNDASRWLEYYNSPYKKIGWDNDGQVANSWGVDAIPVTLLLDRDGKIRFRHVGPLTAALVKQKLNPLIDDLKEKT